MKCKKSTGRYEHKIILRSHDEHDLASIIKMHPMMFIERYQPRSINNIYLDNIAMNNYVANIEGNADRRKVRIRWYGDLFGRVESPTLEFKIKHGMLGTKESYKLAPFIIDDQFDFGKLTTLFRKSDLPAKVQYDLVTERPTLVNRYRRKYYETTDKRFRMTIDYDLQYYHVEPHGNTFLQKHQEIGKTVLEIKYDHSLATEAERLLRHLPFRLSRNSKYVTGVENVLI